MTKGKDFKRGSRALYDWEIEEARRVFGSSLRYERVRVHENVLWTNTIDRIGHWFKKMPYQPVDNAVTIGYHCYFPVRLPAQAVPPGHPEQYKVGWLIHELTHTWQYQRLGWRYLWQAISTHLKFKQTAYDFGGESGLKSLPQELSLLNKFNLEQQGDIARSYYNRLMTGKDVTAWQPYINEFKEKI